MSAPSPPDEVRDYYAAFAEETRLSSGPSRLEFEWTKDVLMRVLPPPPCLVVDVGGAAGAYSLWLAARGYEAHLVDASPRLVEAARRESDRAGKPLASLSVGDARQLPQSDGSAGAVLVMGPLYHLPDPAGRRRALLEAARVLKPGGVLVAAAISRYASALDGLASGLSRDPAFRAIRDRDLLDGQHRNPTGKLDYFTTARRISWARSSRPASERWPRSGSKDRPGRSLTSMPAGTTRPPARICWMWHGRSIKSRRSSAPARTSSE